MATRISPNDCILPSKAKLNKPNVHPATKNPQSARTANAPTACRSLPARRHRFPDHPPATSNPRPLPNFALLHGPLPAEEAAYFSQVVRRIAAILLIGPALAAYRELAQANPDAYLPDVATTLNNLAILYRATQRMSQAEESYAKALAAYRNLAKANPDAYLPNVATTLNNLGYFFLSAERVQEASDHAAEAECILDPLWRANPLLHGNLMARILGTRSEIAEAAHQPAPEACALARRALAAAWDTAIKQEIQQLIDRLCLQPSNESPTGQPPA